MLHKILHNVDPSQHCKLPQFVKPIHSIWHTSQQNDKAFIFAR